MGEPLLLLEAASAYRGDLEDRLTELLATALSEHEGFREALLTHIGVRSEFVRSTVRTQQSFDLGRVRLDLVIRGYDAADQPVVVVFVENKYNPRKLPQPYWFTDDQARRQATALASQRARERYLVAIASDRDLHRYDVPTEYGHKVGWRDIAELASRTGGKHGWQQHARQPSALAAERVLLEFWTYLKGDAVGAISNDDLNALGQIVRAEDRVATLLEQIAEALHLKDDDVSDDWLTAGESPIQYIATEPDDESWLADRREGYLYVLIANAEWNDTGPIGQPHLYAGGGFAAKREERHALTETEWPDQTHKLGLQTYSDAEGVYVLAGRPLSEIVAEADTLSAQARLAAEWAEAVFETVVGLPKPPEPAKRTKRTSRGASSRRADL